MLHQISQFVIKHWMLVSAFIMVLIMLFLEEIKSQGGQVTPTIATHLMNRENAVVIDVRDANAYRDGHIVNAKNFPLSDFDRNQDKLNTYRDRDVIVVDAMGQKAISIVTRLKKAGFTKAVILKGGMDAWKNASLPVVKK